MNSAWPQGHVSLHENGKFYPVPTNFGFGTPPVLGIRASRLDPTHLLDTIRYLFDLRDRTRAVNATHRAQTDAFIETLRQRGGKALARRVEKGNEGEGDQAKEERWTEVSIYGAWGGGNYSWSASHTVESRLSYPNPMARLVAENNADLAIEGYRLWCRSFDVGRRMGVTTRYLGGALRVWAEGRLGEFALLVVHRPGHPDETWTCGGIPSHFGGFEPTSGVTIHHLELPEGTVTKRG